MVRRRHKTHRGRRGRRRPQRFRIRGRRKKLNSITIGIILIISSLIIFRLSFTNAFLNSSEVFLWSLLLSLGLFIAGVLVLVAYWRNNVSMFTTKHSVRWNR